MIWHKHDGKWQRLARQAYRLEERACSHSRERRQW